MEIKKILFLLLLLPFSITALAATETYKIDNNHSTVVWHASHFDFSHPSGKWMVNGTLVLDETKPENSKVDVLINLESLNTGLPEFDKHLKGQLFLDVSKFPTATFVSNKVEITSKDTAKVYGTLNLHGVSKPVTLNVKLNKIGISPISDKKTAGFTARTTIKRSDFGINTFLPGISDEVKIDIEVEAFRT